jgi:pimeloyl-ACP methyl ester carboxylesterase
MDRRTFTAACLLAAGQAFRAGRARADEVQTEKLSTGRFNAVTPTLGGKQLWADELFFHDWHVQRHVFTGHYRLLDGYNLRHAWGTFDECKNKLDEIKRKRNLPPMQGPAIVVLHGLFRTASAMNGISRYLREEGGYTVFNVTYPSTRGTVADHARSLARIVDGLEGIDELNFVGHSLGNLVVRHYLADRARSGSPLRLDPPLKRIVMLGPPNRGAQIAEALAGVGAFHLVAGASASQLAREWDELEANLATPACEFGILAGGRGGERGYNPLLEGDNDLVVSVDSTRLAGAADFAVLPVVHTLMMDDRTVKEYTLRFLEHGYFISAEARRPIPADDALAREPGHPQRARP